MPATEMTEVLNHSFEVNTKAEEVKHENIKTILTSSYVETSSCGSGTTSLDDVAEIEVTKVQFENSQIDVPPVEAAFASSRMNNDSADGDADGGIDLSSRTMCRDVAVKDINDTTMDAGHHEPNNVDLQTPETTVAGKTNEKTASQNDEDGDVDSRGVEPDHVSDISESASDSERSLGIADDWLDETDELNPFEEETGLQAEASNIINRRSFTLTVVSNTSDHESIQNQRENLDRLLMSNPPGGVPGSSFSVGGSTISGMERAGGSISGSLGRPRSNSRGCMERDATPTFPYSYDQNYYRSTDWLRFVPRRSSTGEGMSSSEEEHATTSSGNVTFETNQHQSQGHAAQLAPDQYWRGFDNTRIRTGFFPFHQNNAMTRRRSAEGTGSSMSPHDLSMQGPYIHPGFTNIVRSPIDEEEGGGNEDAVDDSNLTVPKEIRCSSPDIADDSAGGGACKPNIIESGDQGPSNHFESNLSASHSRSHSSNPNRRSSHGEVVQFESSLRVGGIVPPTSPPSYVHFANLPPNLREQQMHVASWDSKYETYACRIDQSQEDRSVEIPLFSMARPHMRAFHFAWFTFFFAFLAWFSITPLLSEVQESLDLTKEQIWTSSIFSVAGAVVSRCVAGVFCDMFGARVISAVVLFICGVPTMFTGLVNSSIGLSILRLIVGIGGSTFVTCQYWTSTMFTREVAGTANALAAGWGNLGGGVAQVLVGSVLFPFFKWIYSSAGTSTEPSELSWRTCCIIPGLLCTIFTLFVIRFSDDSPKGNYRKRKQLGLMQNHSAMKYFKAAMSDHNTWIMVIQYGCCFGVELTTTNAAALYFKEEFELSTEAAAAIASSFGWMNLFARGLGGFLSDVSNAYSGMRGRLVWQFVCFALEGIFVIVFSKARSLGGAIAALMTFSLFVQGAEGSTFGIVPYLNPSLTGTVAGIVGAGGNAGAVIFSILFRQLEYRDAFFWMGVATASTSTLSGLVWIRGYEGLWQQRRMLLSDNKKPLRRSEEPPGTQSGNVTRSCETAAGELPFEMPANVSR